jgi:SAM-dependent MidA family methyltransferase
VTPVEAILRERITQYGPLSFHEVMQTALYHPEHGYYTNLRGFGADGDFVTSPEAHPLFGFLLARQVADAWQALDRPSPLRVLELGGGSGALAEAILSTLPHVQYSIDEPSRSLQAVQRARLAAREVNWRVNESGYHVVLANEVLDALPVHRVTVREGRLCELRVGIAASGELAWVTSSRAPAHVHEYFERLGVLPPEGGVAEVNTALPTWFAQVAKRLERGLALVLDYGYPAEALFARPQGTLLTYWRHTLGSDPLVRLGQQDISAHVDFSSAAQAAQAAGLRVAGVTSQRALLRHLGLEAIQDSYRGPTDRQAIAQLTDPDGLGRIGVLFLTQSLDDYVPVGLTGERDWPVEARLPTLPPDATDRDFLDQWREVFVER